MLSLPMFITPPATKRIEFIFRYHFRKKQDRLLYSTSILDCYAIRISMIFNQFL